MEIYLDANATTPVIAAARDAALAAMSLDFGNPSSTHSRGLQARSLKESVRASARRVLGAASGQLLFVSGATEGIQTAVLSALASLKRAETGTHAARWLLYGATEHKAVPEALAHWNALLGLNLEIRAIPVGQDGRHDLAWLREHAAQAGMVCTMAANNETGVISDLAGIAQALEHSPALWMVDGVQALGKLPLHLQALPIDYAPFSGHKLYAPKGIGMLYVREGAPFTPLIVGGGQEGASRSGTENMTGIAALGAVLTALENGSLFQDHDTLHGFRQALMAALQEAFPPVVFNAALESSLPTTVNFAVPGVEATVLLNLFDAAGVRVSGGSACGAAKARPSYVLEAMGLPAQQIESAIRLSFGPADTADFIDEACTRIRACGAALRQSGLLPGAKQEAEAEVRHSTLLSPIHEQELRPATTQQTEYPAPPSPCSLPDLTEKQKNAAGERDSVSSIEVDRNAATTLAREHDTVLLLDVREAYEQCFSAPPQLGSNVQYIKAPLSKLPGMLPDLLALHAGQPILCICRSGNRSAQAARSVRRLGHEAAWSLAGGLALWPQDRSS